MSKKLDMVITKNQTCFYLKDNLDELEMEYLDGNKVNELYITDDKQTIVVKHNNKTICIPISNIDMYSYYTKPVEITEQQINIYKQMNKDK